MKTLLIVSLVTILGSFSKAKLPPLHELEQTPASIEKDYYIWRYLHEPTTSTSLARRLIVQASRLNTKLKQAYIAKTGTHPPMIKDKTPPTPDHVWKRRIAAKKAFEKGLIALRQNNLDAAVKYFKIAYGKYMRREKKDKALFWLYLSTKDVRYLRHLRQSYDPNIYTLLAADAYKSAYPRTKTFTFQKAYTPGFDATKPLDWARLKAKLRTHPNPSKLARFYASKECIGIATYIQAKSGAKYHNLYFPMPYRSVLKKLPKHRQALLYAIARQESRFVPSAVSRSFALGMMQIMPFLIKHIAKERNEKIDLDAIFHPHKALQYANHHLNYLEKYLYHPLFIAYAYNGGIGFTKRLLKSGKYFKPGPYEPYMSLETIPNLEAREYGKKVLTNYVIYLNKLGIPTRITPFIKQLTNPNKTDRFRSF